MTFPLSWPSLQGFRSFPIDFTWQITVYGKPSGFKRDFGFVATSTGFQGDRKEIESRIKIRSQAVGGIPLWWRSGNRFYASWSYRSPDPDEMGRIGLETQILEWEMNPRFPAAFAALAMLDAVSRSPRTVWSGQAKDSRFADPDFQLPIQSIVATLKEEDFRELVQTGLDQVNRLLNRSEITNLYRDLLSEQTTDTNEMSAITADRPLDPMALACLLLPLDAGRAATCSLAGWRVENSSWSAVVSPDRIADRSAPQQAVADRALLITDAILEKEPSLTNGPRPEVGKILMFARNPLKRTPDENDLPAKDLKMSDGERLLIGDAAEKILADSANLPPYLQHCEFGTIKDAYTSQLERKVDYVIAWAIFLDSKKSANPWVKYLTHPKNQISKILSYWLSSRNGTEAGKRIEKALAECGG